MDIIWFLIGSVVGIAVGWLIFKTRFQGRGDVLREKLNILEQERTRLELSNDQAQQNNLNAVKEIARLEEAKGNLEEQLAQHEKKLHEQFENLANRILDDKSKKFTDQNRTQIGELLNPLKERILTFEKKVEESSQNSLRWNATLKQQIEGLADLNKKINHLMRNTTLEQAAARCPWPVRSVLLAAMLIAIVLTQGEDRAFVYFQF